MVSFIGENRDSGPKGRDEPGDQFRRVSMINDDATEPSILFMAQYVQIIVV